MAIISIISHIPSNIVAAGCNMTAQHRALFQSMSQRNWLTLQSANKKLSNVIMSSIYFIVFSLLVFIWHWLMHTLCSCNAYVFPVICVLIDVWYIMVFCNKWHIFSPHCQSTHFIIVCVQPFFVCHGAVLLQFSSWIFAFTWTNFHFSVVYCMRCTLYAKSNSPERTLQQLVAYNC